MFDWLLSTLLKYQLKINNKHIDSAQKLYYFSLFFTLNTYLPTGSEPPSCQKICCQTCMCIYAKSRISPYSVWMWENTGQKKLRIRTLSTQYMRVPNTPLPTITTPLAMWGKGLSHQQRHHKVFLINFEQLLTMF